MNDWRDYSHEVREVRSPLVRGLLLLLGAIFLGLGVIGIFLPVLPTVPFVLLAAVCWARASGKFYNWIMNHSILGPPLRRWKADRSLPLRVKVIAVGMITVSMGISLYWFVRHFWLRLAMIATGIVVSAFILRLPTRRE